jgi:hypothetical protein
MVQMSGLGGESATRKTPLEGMGVASAIVNDISLRYQRRYNDDRER